MESTCRLHNPERGKSGIAVYEIVEKYLFCSKIKMLNLIDN